MIRTKKTLKFLGLIIDHKLEWNHHVNEVSKKCKRTLYGIKILRKASDNDKAIKQIMISLFYSRLYYACEIWLNNSTSKKLINSINSLDRSAARVYLCDWKYGLTRSEVASKSPFSDPLAWSDYCLWKLLFNIIHEQEPETIFVSLLTTNCISRRFPHKPIFF